MMHQFDDLEGTEIAVIGMAGRFPGAKNLTEFWQNLRDGVESIRPLTEEELDALQVAASLRHDPNYVAVASAMDDIDHFDAAFFDYTPREAEIMDPQQRIFLECSWEALEHAGYDAHQYKRPIGVFAGSTTSNYLVYNLVSNQELLRTIDPGQIDIGNGADFLATRVSYKLDLKGPSFSVQTACSTSLVASHLACQALLNEECDLALAGGIAVHVDHPKGYRYVEGSILTPDGHTRAFDAEAAGTVFSSGVGVVVLKRLEDALADGDHIHAIIKGSAINNDGSNKVGYVAPSVEGQAEVITEALAVANVDPTTISYVETHGAGTRLGDPIEIRGLTKAYRTYTDETQFCAIGSVKTNVGHLTGAAGVAGLLKTVLSLEHKQLPPMLHFQRPNPEIDFDNSPFFPNAALTEWQANGEPRRAGVSSFGLGGTNAHMILEEMPPLSPSGDSRPFSLLLLSAKTPTALVAMSQNLAQHLEANPDLNLADVAYTLQVGRRPFDHRRMLLCQDRSQALAALQAPDSPPVMTASLDKHRRQAAVVFLFSDQGTVRATDLYHQEPVFREQVEICLASLPQAFGTDVRVLLDPHLASDPAPSTAVERAAHFIFNYALARLWQSWGVTPVALIGRGVGEAAAACVADVLPVAEALLWLTNGRLPQPTTAPQIPYISSQTGTWITPAQALDPAYYTHLLDATADRLVEGLQLLQENPAYVLLEIGPEPTHIQQITNEAITALASLDSQLPDQMALLTTLGHLWLAGVTIDWSCFYADERRYRLPLPTYPFERQRFWIERQVDAAPSLSLAKKEAIADWFYTTAWKSTPPASPVSADDLGQQSWLLFMDQAGVGTALAAWLQEAGQTVMTVTAGAQFSQTADEYTLHPGQAGEYKLLLESLTALPDHIIHLWSLTTDEVDFDTYQTMGFGSLIFLTQALGLKTLPASLPLTIISNQLCCVLETEPLVPAKATLLGASKVIPQEYPAVACRTLDVVLSPTIQLAQLSQQLLAEITSLSSDGTVALRGQQRWVSDFVAAAPTTRTTPLRPLRQQGVYLITGGLSDIGLDLAAFLAETVQARLVLVDQPPAATNGTDPQQIEKALTAKGAEVFVVHAAVTDEAALAMAVTQALTTFGSLHGVIHAPSVSNDKAFRPIAEIDKTAVAEHFDPKLKGVMALAQALAGQPLDFCILTSALSVALGGVGFAPFTAAAFGLDAFAYQQNLTAAYPWISIGWDVWRLEGEMAQLTAVSQELVDLALTPTEGGAVLQQVLAGTTTSQMLISTGDLHARIQHNRQRQQALRAQTPDTLYERPDIWTEYVAPRNEIEQQVVDIWQKVLGIEPIGVLDNFFDLGGHSLLATQLRTHLHEKFKVELPLRSLFDDATAAGIARLIETSHAEAGETVPITERLQAAFPVERPDIMAEYLQQKLANALDIDAARLAEDDSLAELDLQVAAVDLMWHFKQDFKVQFYPHELTARPSVTALSQFVLEQVERMANLPAYATDKPLSAYTIKQHRERAPRKRPSGPSPKNKSMVFLLSSPRSGSTLLRVMLAGHPRIFCPPEISLLFFEDMREWQENVSFGQDFQWPAEGLHWALVELAGLESDEGWQLLDQIVAENWTVQRVYAYLQELVGERLLVDKTPPYAMDPETLRRAEARFEAPKYIHLVRHPYAMIESFLRVRLDQQFSSSLFEETNPDPYIIAETIWATANRNLLQFLSQVDPARHHLLRYEDMVRNPHQAMQALCRFLDIPFDTAVVNPYDGRRERMMGGVGDPNILTHTTIDPKLGQVWKKIKLPRALDETTKALATTLGYELPDNVQKPTAELRALRPLPTPEQPLEADLLADLDNLSDEEVTAMLGKLLAEEG